MFLQKYGIVSIALLLLLLASGLSLAATPQPLSEIANDGGYIKLDANIMTIDLVNSEMVIAEREVKLKTSIDSKGVRRYTTMFLDAAGNKIEPEAFRPRDMVVLEGVELSNGIVIADSITLYKMDKSQ